MKKIEKNWKNENIENIDKIDKIVVIEKQIEYSILLGWGNQFIFEKESKEIGQKEDRWRKVFFMCSISDVHCKSGNKLRLK